MALALTNYDPAVQQGATVDVSGSMSQIADTNSNEALIITATTNAVNELTLINSATTDAVQLNATGDDTNVGFNLATKGTGGFTLTAATETGVEIDLVSAALTTGKAIDISDLDAITTGKAIHVDATGTTHTSGILVHIDSAGTAIDSTGRLFLSDHTGATTTSGILNEFKSAANDETVVVKITAASLTSGTTLDISAAALTTGKLIDMSDLDAITTGKAIHVDATGVTQTDGILVHIDSASTALTATGRLLLVDHTGNAGVSNINSEFKSAAADETTIVRINATGLLAAGVALDLVGTSVTTGTMLDISGLDALTTGGGIVVNSNSADTGTRSLVSIVNDNTASTGTTPLAIQNDATAGAHIKLTGSGILGIDFTALGATDFLWDCTAASGCTAAPQTNAAVGFITCKVGGTQQWIPYYDAT